MQWTWIALTIFANTACAESETSQLIEQLSVDGQFGTRSYMLANMQRMEIQRCTLTLLSELIDGSVISRRTVELTAARILPDYKTDYLYTWSTLEPSVPPSSDDLTSVGTIVFQALRPGAITLHRPQDPDDTPGDLLSTGYVMWHNPTEDTMARLAAALATYQQESCIPLG